jgi:hypothetical protein
MIGQSIEIVFSSFFFFFAFSCTLVVVSLKVGGQQQGHSQLDRQIE